MLKRFARFVLRKELAAHRANAEFASLMLDQWKLSAKTWETYAKTYVPPETETYRDWFMRTVAPLRNNRDHLT